MTTYLSFKSVRAFYSASVFGVDESGCGSIRIHGKWIYEDLRSRSPSRYLARIKEPSCIFITSSHEKGSLFFIDKFKSSITKKYAGEIGAIICVTESNLTFLSNLIREDMEVRANFVLDISNERDAEFIDSVIAYEEKSKVIKFEVPIAEFSITVSPSEGKAAGAVDA